jgi:hypothetical protein
MKMIHYIIFEKRPSMKMLRDRLLEAADNMESAGAPPRLAEATQTLRKALRKVERCGIKDDTTAAALMAEALPRIIACYGPAHTAALLIDLARSIGAEGEPSPLQ